MALRTVFYYPHEIPDPLPEDPLFYIREQGKTWILQTVYHLRRNGYPAELTNEIPESGIVIGHSYELPRNLRPTGKLFVVSVQADFRPHPYANADIVQNPVQARDEFAGRRRYYMTHWPQNGLIPRDESRGEAFENLSYFGVGTDGSVRDEEFKKWLKENGFNFILGWKPSSWLDYSNADAVVALRNTRHLHSHKPATKLYNAWAAGVIPIMGPESAYWCLQKSDLDFVRVRNTEEIKKALLSLREDPKLRRRIIENGRERARHFTLERTARRWIDLLEVNLLADANIWFRTPAWKRALRNAAQAAWGRHLNYTRCVLQQRGPTLGLLGSSR